MKIELLNHQLAHSIAADVYEMDPEHFDGGCGDISHLLWRHFTSVGVPCKVIGGRAACRKNAWFTHVWLEIDGEDFDPMNVSHERPIRFYERLEPSKAEKIILRHTDDSLFDYWEDSYEKSLLEQALAKDLVSIE